MVLDHRISSEQAGSHGLDINTRFLRPYLERLAARLPCKTLYGQNGAYLSRHRVLDVRFLKVFLHHFHRGDEDYELHNHPWLFAVSLILVNGYCEWRRPNEGRIKPVVFLPGALNFIWPGTYHRVDLLGPDVWSIMVAGPSVQDWGFWDRFTGKVTPWEEFIRSKNHDPTAKYVV